MSQRLEEPQGLSLWNLDVDWAKIGGDGPVLEMLPSAFWLIGLGHLGQAYLWTLSLLPYEAPASCQFMLQDFDVLKEGNRSAALVSKDGDVGKLKTKICRDWLDSRGFIGSSICDRAFDKHTIRSKIVGRVEPHIACAA